MTLRENHDSALLKLFAVITVTAGQNGGEIIYVNELFCQLSGHDYSDLIGHSLDMVIPARHRTAHDHYRQGFEERPSSRPMGPDRQVQLRHKDGHGIGVWVGLDPDKYDNPSTVTAVILPMDIVSSYDFPHADQSDVEERPTPPNTGSPVPPGG